MDRLNDCARHDLKCFEYNQLTNQDVFEHKIEVIISWHICIEVLVPMWIPGVDITEDYLPENKF